MASLAVHTPPAQSLSTQRPLRILHVAEAFGGGLFEMVRLVAAGTAAHGHRVDVAYGRRPETPDDVRAAVDARVALHDLDWRRGSLSSHLDAARRLRALVRRQRPDVVHLHSSFAGVVGSLALEGRVPMIYTAHAFASGLPGTSRSQATAYRIGERMTVNRVSLVGAVGASEGEYARAVLGARRVTVVPNGIPELDPEAIARAATRSLRERPLIVGVGRTNLQRRPADCARILGQLGDVADLRWVGGGRGEDSPGRGGREALRAAGVGVTGWLPRSEVISHLCQANAYLHWTTWDGLPMQVLEAMACDTIVIASDTPPNREVLHPDQLCVDEQEAAGKLRRVVTDADFAARLLSHQHAIRAGHAAEVMVARWLGVYDRLARRERVLERARAVVATRGAARFA